MNVVFIRFFAARCCNVIIQKNIPPKKEIIYIINLHYLVGGNGLSAPINSLGIQNSKHVYSSSTLDTYI